MLAHGKVGGLNQRRFVVEIARPVAPADVEGAAAYIARRLSMDEGRIRTLLSNRTGPVSRDVLADKADAIAKVFGEAGLHARSAVGVAALPLGVPARRLWRASNSRRWRKRLDRARRARSAE